MRRVVEIVLGTLNILVGILMLFFYSTTAFTAKISDGFKYGWPMLLFALFALISGIFTLKKGVWGLAIISLITAFVAFYWYLFYIIILYGRRVWNWNLPQIN